MGCSFKNNLIPRTYNRGETVAGCVVIAGGLMAIPTDRVRLACGGHGQTCGVAFEIGYEALATLQTAGIPARCPACGPGALQIGLAAIAEPGPKPGTATREVYEMLLLGRPVQEIISKTGVCGQTVDVVRLRWIVAPAARRLELENAALRRELAVFRADAEVA